MKKQFLFLLLLGLLCSVGSVWGDISYYTPSEDEVIILNEVYNADNTTSGYSTHTAVLWGGTASTNSKKAGDPNNGGAATSSNVACYSVKGNGGGKDITINITGVSSIIIYHESHSSRYVELRDGSKSGTLIDKGSVSTYYTEVSLTGSTDYSIFLHGTTGSDDQDFNVYAIKLIKYYADPVPVTGITISPASKTIKVGRTVTLAATVTPANATDKAVTWAVTSGGTYASVNESGVVTGLAVGTATITATAHDGSGVTQTATVTVEECPANGTMYKFQVKTGLTNGNIASSVPSDIDATTSNYLSTLTGGTLTIAARNNVNRVLIVNNSAIGFANGADAFLKMELDCDIEAGDIIKYTIASNNMELMAGSESESTNKMTLDRSKTQVEVDSKLVGASALYMKRSSSSPNISYFEIYRPIYRTITLEYADGATDDGSLRVIDGEKATKPADPTWEHHRFDGWYNGENAYDWTTTVSGDITLTAHWTQLYTITYAKGDNDATGDAPTQADKAATETFTVAANTFALEGKVFDHWNDGTNDYEPNDTYTVGTANVTLTAVWRTPSTMYAITKGAHEHGDFTIDPATQEAGMTVTLEATPDEGYKFESWSVEGTGAELSSTTTNPTTLTMGAADATVSATFRALYTYTITYNKGANGSGSDIADGEKTEDANFTLSSAMYTRDGYAQTGWSLTDGGEKAYNLGGTYTGNDDLDLYPYWVEAYSQTNVTGAATWDWSKLTGDGNQLADAIKNVDIVFANIPLYDCTTGSDASFDAAALLINGQYAWRDANDSKFMQGNKAQFNTTVPGTVTIEYANTGGNPKRTVVVNGTWGTKTSSANNSYQSESFETEAGTITITGVQTETVKDKGTAGDPKMLRIRKIVFTPASHSITATPDYYATFCAPYKVSVPDGVEAYTARYSAIDENTGQLTLDVWTNVGRRVIPANLPVILKGESTSFVLTATSADVDNFGGTNNLHGTPSAALDASTVSTAYVLGVVEDLTGFYKKESGEIPVNKAYLIIDGGAAAAPQFIRIVEGENGATSIGSIEQTEQAVKFIENGRILIKKNGIVYDALGRIVK